MEKKNNPGRLASTSFHLAEEVIEQLRTAAFERRESQASIVTDAVRAYLQLPPPTEAKLTKAESEIVDALLDLMRFEANHSDASRKAIEWSRKANAIVRNLLAIDPKMADYI